MQNQENEYELLYMINQNDEIALQKMIVKYQKVIDCKLAEIVYDKAFYRQQRDEMRQQGYILLMECLEQFNYARNARFSAFFNFCFERKIRNYMKMYYARKSFNTNTVSLDQPIDENGEFTLGDNIESKYAEYQSDTLVREQSMKEAMNEVTSDFSPVEQTICLLKQAGYTYPEIVSEVACNYRKVDNTIQKFRRALNIYLKQHYY